MTLPKGSCLCGGVRFSVPGPVGAVTACHCTQCRKTSGHFAASFDISGAPDYSQRETLGQYRSAGGATRGFCTRCGSSLWFRSKTGDWSVEAGVIDGLTHAHLDAHIFVADKGDYYSLSDGLPQSEGAAC